LTVRGNAIDARQSRLPSQGGRVIHVHILIGFLLVVSAAARADEAARAEEVIRSQCAICHGTEGESSTPVFPRLAAQHADYVARQLADFQAGRRKSAVMEPMAKDLTSGEMQAIGRWFESRPARAHDVADLALVEQGREVYERGLRAKGVPACKKCHGLQGEGTDTLPRLGGQHVLYLETQLRAFSQRKRTNDNMVMQTIAARISDEELRAVSSYISGLR
jgi:cytochrome c553